MSWLQQWIWQDAGRRGRNLLRFAETEADGARDLVHAAERTGNPVLRRLYLAHAADEQRHAELLRRRGMALLRSFPKRTRETLALSSLTPGERGLDDLQVEKEADEALLAFLHLSEKAATRSFSLYRDALPDDPATRAVFDEILRDETFHMNYTLSQLGRVSPERYRVRLWRARFGRLWKAYLRLATGLGGAIAGLVLSVLYFVLLPPFAILAKRAQRREPVGWHAVAPARGGALKRQY